LVDHCRWSSIACSGDLSTYEIARTQPNWVDLPDLLTSYEIL
jgi:hypothetical protein